MKLVNHRETKTGTTVLLSIFPDKYSIPEEMSIKSFFGIVMMDKGSWGDAYPYFLLDVALKTRFCPERE
jgi:hypothetical protein